MFTTTLRALTIALMITGFGAGDAFAGEVTTAVPGEPGFVDVGLFIQAEDLALATLIIDLG